MDVMQTIMWKLLNCEFSLSQMCFNCVIYYSYSDRVPLLPAIVNAAVIM